MFFNFRKVLNARQGSINTKNYNPIVRRQTLAPSRAKWLVRTGCHTSENDSTTLNHRYWMGAVRSYGPEPANTKQTQKFWQVDRNQRME